MVKLCKVMPDGRQQIVGLQFAPDFIGRPFVPESTLSAEAATPTEICVFPRGLLDRMITDTPELQHNLHAQALKELDAAREWMLTLGRRTTFPGSPSLPLAYGLQNRAVAGCFRRQG